MKYHKHQGIILKKQNYREADEIITFWTKETGKVRAVARGARKSTSKLAYNLQTLALVQVEFTRKSSHLPTIIGAQTVKNFRNLRSDLGKIGTAIFASELMLKMTADEQPNEEAFNLLNDFLNYLNNPSVKVSEVCPARESFSLKLLKALGFGLGSIENKAKPGNYAANLGYLDFFEAQKMQIDAKHYQKLHSQVIDFIESILERNLKSKVFLRTI